MSSGPVDIEKSLTELIGQRLGRDRDRDEIENALSGYLSNLGERLRKTGLVEIRGFGAFKFIDGRIEFEPDLRLAEAINFRYAGLEELSVASETPAESGAIEIDPTAVDSDLAAEFVSVTPDRAPVEPSDSVDWLPISEQVFPDQQKSEASEPVSQPEPAPQPEREPASRGRSSDKSTNPSTTTQSGTGKTGRRRAILLIVVPLIVIGTAIGGIAIYNSITGQADRPTMASSENPPADDPLIEQDDEAAQAPGTVTGQALPDNSPETGTDSVISDPASTEAPSAIPPPVSEEPSPDTENAAPGISGFVSDFDRSATGYTLMVGSVFNEIDAQRGIVRFNSVDLPKAILTDEENGIVRYRLALGRFDTIESAQEEIDRLGNRIPSDTWVYRIRLNTVPPGQQN